MRQLIEKNQTIRMFFLYFSTENYPSSYYQKINTIVLSVYQECYAIQIVG
ncbi:unnamed protein product, partial [Tenebrio molitor]